MRDYRPEIQSSVTVPIGKRILFMFITTVESKLTYWRYSLILAFICVDKFLVTWGFFGRIVRTFKYTVRIF